MDSCKLPSHNFILFDNIVLHILILFSLLTCLFVFYISKITYTEFNDQFKSIVDQNIDPDKLKAIIAQRSNPDTVKKLLISYLNIDTSLPQNVIMLNSLTAYIINLQNVDITNLNGFFIALSNNYLNTQDQLRSSINQKLHQQLIMLIVFFIIMAFLINFLSGKAGYCGSLKHLGIELLIIFSCVGAIEYWFFTNVASKFVPVYPTTIITSFKDKMNKLLS